MLSYADGTDTRPASAVRNAERLVKIEMTHVSANLARRAETNLGVQVGTVHIHLAAVLVDKRTDLLDSRFVNTKRARIGDHYRGQFVFVFFALCL